MLGLNEYMLPPDPGQLTTQKPRFRDTFLLAAWVYSYGFLLWVFRLLLLAEKDESKAST
jgi:hypothetical protein